MDTEQHTITIKRFIYFQHANFYQSLDDSTKYDSAVIGNLCTRQLFLDQSLQQYIDLRADWADDQHNLPDTVRNINRAFISKHAETDKRIENANNVLLREKKEQGLSTRLQKTNEVLLRVGIKRSLLSINSNSGPAFQSWQSLINMMLCSGCRRTTDHTNARQVRGF